MKYSLEFLAEVEDYAKKELLEFMVLSCKEKEIPLFISEAILVAIENAKN